MNVGEGIDFSPLLPMLHARDKADMILRQLQRECRLRVAYPLSAGRSSDALPSLRLQLPPLLESLIGVSQPDQPRSKSQHHTLQAAACSAVRLCCVPRQGGHAALAAE